MKNFLLQKTVHEKSRWLLLHLNSVPGDDVEYKPFTDYVIWLIHKKGYATNTVDQYAAHVARFLDFIYEAASVVKDPDFSHLIYLYESYLLFGKASDNREVSELAERLNKDNPTTNESIAQGIEASIRGFIRLQITRSENITSTDIFANYYIETTLRSDREIKAIKDNSWLAGTIKNSLRKALPIEKESLFPRAKRRSKKSASIQKNSPTIAFPLEEAVEFLTQKRSPHKKSTFIRDMCIFSLLATSGIRTSECLQIQIHDIDTINKKIHIKPPFSRQNKGLTDSESDELVWKGRTIETTFLIEPFATIFWDYFETYIREFYKTSIKHDFVFQKSDGRPLFASGDSGRSNRNKTFKKYARKIDLTDLSGLSPHSLRHMYGFYVLNYLPVDSGNQLGLPMSFVQVLMGHQSIKSTERYALHDTDLLEAYVELANKYTKQKNIKLSDLKDMYIDRQIKKLELLKGDTNV